MGGGGLLAGPNQDISLPAMNTVLVGSTAPHRETRHITPTGTKQTVIALGFTLGMTLSSHTIGDIKSGQCIREGGTIVEVVDGCQGSMAAKRPRAVIPETTLHTQPVSLLIQEPASPPLSSLVST